MPPAPQPAPRALRIGFLGPVGTFTEQALLTQPDLAAGDLVPFASIPEILAGVEDGRLDLGFVPIENAIEGTVNLTQDALAFTHDLLIQREVVLDIQLCLMGPPGMQLEDVTAVLSFPVATAQCRRFFDAKLPQVRLLAANSTAEAARIVGEQRPPGTAAIATALAAELYGLEVIATGIADLEGNQTRFVLVARDGIPAPTGHDKTSIVVYQRANVPGSLISILQEFAARRINLSKLESRPTKRGGLGDYCFVIDAEGHVTDEVLADCLRGLHAKQGGVKFLGSYPAAGDHGDAARQDADTRWRDAEAWVESLRARVRSDG